MIPQFLFDYIDTDKNGSISPVEFRTFINNAYQSHGLRVPNIEEVNQTFSQIDTKRSGAVSIAELKDWFNKQNGRGPVAEIANQVAFDRIDRNKDKTISSNEFVEAIKDYTRAYNLGSISEDSIRGPYYNVLSQENPHFRHRHFERLVENLIYEPRNQAASRAAELAASREWPRFSVQYLLKHMLLNNLFRAIDIENHGKISMHEFMNFFKQFAYSHGWDLFIPSDVNYLYNLIDLNRDGLITLKEVSYYFDNAIQSGNNLKIFSLVATTLSFERLDEDRTGTLSLQEFERGLQRYARSHQIQSPENLDVLNSYREVASGNSMTLLEFKQLISKQVLGGISFEFTKNPSGPVKLRTILNSLLSEGLFNAIDSSHKGSFGYYDFSGFLIQTAKDSVLNIPSVYEMRTIFHKIDTNHDGSISLAELKQYLSDQLVTGNEVTKIVEFASAVAFRLLNKSFSGDLSIEEWRSGIVNWALTHNIDIPTDEVLNEAWRHAIGVSNNFNIYTFITLISSQYGLGANHSVQARLY